MERAEALGLVRAAVAAGRSGGFLVTGALKTSCLPFVEEALALLFPEASAALAAGAHPDVFRLGPQGKSRTIKVERKESGDGPGMRDGVIEPMNVTAFAGGWKAAVIESADRMQTEAANVLLKSLEEPTPKSMYFLLTDQPDAVMATIVSRCQRIDLQRSEGLLEGEDFSRVKAVFDGLEDLPSAKAAAARKLAALLAEFKDNAEDAEVPLVRKAFFTTLLSFARGWMISGAVERFRAFRNVEAVEEAYRQSERYLSDEMTLSFLLDRMTLPA